MSEEEIKHLMQSHYNLHEKYEQLKQENQQLKSVLDEIREWSKKKKQKMYKSRNQIAVYMLNDLLQILDKVKE